LDYGSAVVNLFLAKGRGHEVLLAAHTSTCALALHDSSTTALHSKTKKCGPQKTGDGCQSPTCYIPTVSFLRKDQLLFICTLHRAALFRAVNVILQASSNSGSWLRLERTTTNGKKNWLKTSGRNQKQGQKRNSVGQKERKQMMKRYLEERKQTNKQDNQK